MVKDYSNNYDAKRINIIKNLIPKGAYSSLDIACNIGVFSKILFDKGHSVTGMDIDSNNIAFAKEMYKDCRGLNFLNEDIESFMQNNNLVYDFILALEIIEHFDDCRKFIKDCSLLLKKNGRLIISTPNRYSTEALIGSCWAMINGKKYVGWDVTHKRIFNSFEFVWLLKRQNFLIKKIVGYYYDSNTILRLLRFKIRASFDSSYSFPLNRFGFNTIVVAERYK